MRPLALPQDRPEVDVGVSGAAGAAVTVPRGVRLTAASRTLIPLTRELTLDSRGQGTITAPAVSAAAPSAFGVGRSATPTRGAIAGATLGAIAEVRASRAGQFARELAYAIGPAIQAVERSRVVAEYVGFGAALAVTLATQARMVLQRFPDTATDLLSAWELRLRLPVSPAATVADRQALALARLRGAFGGPESRVLSAMRAIDPTATIRNGKSLECAAAPKKVYLFAVVIDPAVWAETSKREQINAIVRQMAPAHALFNTATRVGFRCDDPASLTDRDILGA